jgi:NADPH-dependent 2,4-dienoyl-CoA reductase/sulfur reductase-like enzyme
VTRTVDLVIVGAHLAVMAAAIEAARRGLRVLVVIRSGRARFGGRLRRSVRAAGAGLHRQLTVLTGAEVVCVDGINSVEAVVIRRLRTGRLIGVNASGILAFARPDSPPHPLANLGLARSAVLSGDRTKAGEAYHVFFELWNDADTDRRRSGKQDGSSRVTRQRPTNR